MYWQGVSVPAYLTSMGGRFLHMESKASKVPIRQQEQYLQFIPQVLKLKLLQVRKQYYQVLNFNFKPGSDPIGLALPAVSLPTKLSLKV